MPSHGGGLGTDNPRLGHKGERSPRSGDICPQNSAYNDLTPDDKYLCTDEFNLILAENCLLTLNLIVDNFFSERERPNATLVYLLAQMETHLCALRESYEAGLREQAITQQTEQENGATSNKGGAP